MMRAVVRFWLGSAMGLALLVTADPALPQGTIGGTIGKTDKTLGGDTVAPPRVAKPPARNRAPRSRDTANAPAGQILSAGVVGSWDWEASCSEGHFKGEWKGGMNIREISPDNIVGEFTKGHLGGIEGRVSGRQISFVREIAGLVQQKWNASLAGGAKPKMQGTFTTPGASGCRFSATKN